MKIRETWINLLHGAATGTRRTRMLLTPVGLLVFFGFSASFVLAAVFVDKALGLPGLLPGRRKGGKGVYLLLPAFDVLPVGRRTLRIGKNSAPCRKPVVL